MRRRAVKSGGWVLAGVALLWSIPGLAGAAGEGTTASRFPTAKVLFEQNATDGDVEVVFQVTGRSEGLAKLSVVGPDGRTVVDFSAPDSSTMGIREFELESPEPPDAARIKAAYPEGVYAFSGKTASGKELRSEARLSHSLPAPTSFVKPAAEASGVPSRGLEISWTPVAGVSGYIVEIEQDELAVTQKTSIPGTTTRLGVPDGFLRPGTEYNLGIGTVSAEGNVSFVETSFTTAP